MTVVILLPALFLIAWELAQIANRLEWIEWIYREMKKEKK